jgi:hypothetical protein
VREHDGKDDDEGQRIESTKECAANFRLYTGFISRIKYSLLLN